MLLIVLQSAQHETMFSYKVDSRQPQTNTPDFHARVGWKADLDPLSFSKSLETTVLKGGCLIGLQVFKHLLFSAPLHCFSL